MAKYPTHSHEVMAKLGSRKRFRVFFGAEFMAETNDPFEAIEYLRNYSRACIKHNSGWAIMNGRELAKTKWGYFKTIPDAAWAAVGAPYYECSQRLPHEELLHRVAEHYKRPSCGLEPPYLLE